MACSHLLFMLSNQYISNITSIYFFWHINILVILYSYKNCVSESCYMRQMMRHCSEITRTQNTQKNQPWHTNKLPELFFFKWAGLDERAEYHLLHRSTAIFQNNSDFIHGQIQSQHFTHTHKNTKIWYICLCLAVAWCSVYSISTKNRKNKRG